MMLSAILYKWKFKTRSYMKCYIEYNNITEEMGLGDSSAPIATPLEKVISNCKGTCMAVSSGFSYSFPK